MQMKFQEVEALYDLNQQNQELECVMLCMQGDNEEVHFLQEVVCCWSMK